jgi:hypothetical protein
MNNATATTLIITSQYSIAPSRPTARELANISTMVNASTHAAPGTEGNQ